MQNPCFKILIAGLFSFCSQVGIWSYYGCML